MEVRPETGLDLQGFGEPATLSCGAHLRRRAADAASMEAAAQAVVDGLYETFGGAGPEPEFALLRLFRSMRTKDARAACPQGLPGPDDAPAMVLLGSRGLEPAWCGRLGSRKHQLIPLPDPDALDGIPMVMRLLQELGLGEAMWSAEAPFPADHELGVFHIEEAAQSPYVPDQDFVRAHGIKSVVGFGGTLPGRDVFVVLGFARSAVPLTAADRLRLLASHVRAALIARPRAPVFETGSGQEPDIDVATALAQRVDALEAVLRQYDAFTLEQARRLEDASARHREERRFLAELGHEIRTPLNGIRFVASKLSEGGMSDPETLEILKTSTVRLHAYADRIAELGRAGDMEDDVELDDRFARACVLVADDEPTNRLVARRMLAALGVERVLEASDGREALEQFADVDLILMDVQMPELDGLAATRQIRKERPELPVVAMTASVLIEQREACARAGMTDFLPKPLDRALLRAVLIHWLRRDTVQSG